MADRAAARYQPEYLADAIRYALSRWDGLTNFTDDGCKRLTPTPSNIQSAR